MESHAVIGALSLNPEVRDTFALSPDGAFVAHLTIEERSPASPAPVLQPGYERNGERPQYERHESVEILSATTSAKAAEYEVPSLPEYWRRWEQWNRSVSLLTYCDRGKYLVVSGGNGRVFILDTGTYRTHGIIDLGTVSLRPNERDSAGGDPGAESADVACAANADVLVIQLHGGRFGSGVVKLFDLNTAEGISGGDALSTDMLRGNTAISADGISVATVQAIGPGSFRVAVLDLQRQRVLRNISFNHEDLNSGSPHLWFLGSSILAVRRAGKWEEFLNLRSSGGRRKIDDKDAPPAMLCWDVASGAKLDSCSHLTNLNLGVMGVSTDGSVVLSDTGKTNWCRKCNHRDGKLVIEYAQITLWNRETGQAVASSQHLPVLHHKCLLITLFGDCEEADEAPALSLSQDGNAVLAYWPGGAEPVTVFYTRATF